MRIYNKLLRYDATAHLTILCCTLDHSDKAVQCRYYCKLIATQVLYCKLL